MATINDLGLQGGARGVLRLHPSTLGIKEILGVSNSVPAIYHLSRRHKVVPRSIIIEEPASIHGSGFVVEVIPPTVNESPTALQNPI